MKLNYIIFLILFSIGCSTKETSEKSLSSDLLEVSEKLNPTQKFIIDPRTDTVLLGKKGTRIYISANSFKSKNGETITELFNLNLKEVYDPFEMILNDLSTTSNGALLESSGMVKITASSEGNALELQNKSTIRLRFKNLTNSDYMRSFNGLRDSTGINWEIDNNVIDTLTFQRTEKRVVVLSYGADSAISNTINYGVVGLDTFEISRINSYDLYDSTAPAPQPYYELNSSKLNWINCDYFLNPDSVITVYLNSSTDFSTRDYIVFKDINSVMNVWGHNDDSVKVVNNIPFNYEVTFVSIGMKNDKYFLATKNKKMSKSEEIIDLNYKSVNFKKLINELQKFE